MLETRDVLGRRERLGEHRSAAHLDGLLLEVAHDRVFREGDAALVVVLPTGDDLEQRGLARAVRAHERDAIARAHTQTGPREEHARAEGLGDVVDREDHSGSV